MENNLFEDKENLPPGVKRRRGANEGEKRKGSGKGRQDVKVLRENMMEMYRNWRERSEGISEVLTTPEELEAARKEARGREFKNVGRS